MSGASAGTSAVPVPVPVPVPAPLDTMGRAPPSRFRPTTEPPFRSLDRSGTPQTPVNSENLLRRLESLSPAVGDPSASSGNHFRSRTTSSSDDLALSQLSLSPILAANGPDRRPSTSLSLSYTALELREIAREIKNAEVDLNNNGSNNARKRIVLVAGIRSRNEATELTSWLFSNLEVDLHVATSLLPFLEPLLPKGSKSSIQAYAQGKPILPSLQTTADLLISIGGDGTALRAAWLFQGEAPPLLAFRTEISRSEGVAWQGRARGVLAVHLWRNWKTTTARIFGLSTLVDRLAVPSSSSSFSSAATAACQSVQRTSGYRILFRTRLSCTVIRCAASMEMLRRGVPGTIPRHGAPFEEEAVSESTTYEILNELIVDRGPSPYLSLLELHVSTEDAGMRSTVIQADGVVLSTPTGSTAYSLSAGGSIVHPDVGAILITPIAPHELTLRPFILPHTMDLCLVVPTTARSPAWASFDSRARLPVYPGDEVHVRASDWPLPCVAPDESDHASTMAWGVDKEHGEMTVKGPRRRSLSNIADEEDSSSEPEDNVTSPKRAAPSPSKLFTTNTSIALQGLVGNGTPDGSEEGFEDEEEEDEGTFGHFRGNLRANEGPAEGVWEGTITETD